MAELSAEIPAEAVAALNRLSPKERNREIDLYICDQAGKDLFATQWLIQKHRWIKDKAGKIRPLKRLKLAQRKTLAVLHYCRTHKIAPRIIIGKSRKQGESTIIGADCYEEVKKHQFDALILAHDKAGVSKIFSIYQRFYKYDDLPKPEPYKGKVNLREMRFQDHDGHITVATARNVYAGTGETPQYVHCSEGAKWEHGEDTLTSLNQAIGDEAETTFIHESTFNGEESCFLPIWRAAYDNCKLEFIEKPDNILDVKFTVTNHAEWNHFIPIFISVLDDEDARLAFIDEEDKRRFAGTLDAYEKHLIDDMQASLEFLHWRRRTLKLKCKNDIEVFMQEYPTCLTAETRVSTEYGMIPIAEAEYSRMTESGSITSWGPQAESDICRLETRCGRTLRGTYDHPVMLQDGKWILLSELQTGDKIKLLPPRFAEYYYIHSWNDIPSAETRFTINEEWGYFLGFFMGDGYWGNNIISFVCDKKDEDVIEFIRKITLKTIGVNLNPRSVGSKQGGVELRAGCKIVRKYLEALGAISRIGDKGSWKRKVCVPECIFRSPKNVVRTFLSALFECDGSASCNRVRFGSCHRDFMSDVQLLLLGFGINCEIKEAVKWAGGMKYQYKFFYIDLGIELSQKFHDDIGFVGLRKQSLRPKDRQKLLAPWFTELIDEVKNVVKEGLQEVTYDLTVEPDHIISANGIYTHNTPSEAIRASGRPRFNVTKLDSMPMEAGQKGRLRYMDTWDQKIVWQPDPQAELTRFRDPKPGHAYIIGCDPAEGSSLEEEAVDPKSRLDASVIEVFDMDEGYEEAANYHAITTPENLAEPLRMLALYYNNAFVVIESNSAGRTTCIKLAETYDNALLYHEDDWNPQKTRRQRSIGHKTTGSNRDHILSLVADAINEDDIVFHDIRTIEEHRYFVYTKTGKPEAARGHHDDHVMAVAKARAGIPMARQIQKMKTRVKQQANQSYAKVHQRMENRSYL